MRARIATWAALAFAGPLAASAARAQPNLPPPPPPPLSTETPPPPPPPNGSGAGGGSSTRTRPRPAPAKSRPAEHVAERAQNGGGTIGTSDPAPSFAPRPRDVSLRFNVLPIFQGRISADGELMFAPHHAVIVSPNVTFSANRWKIVEDAFGYAPRGTGGVGTEVGYHYWLARQLEGLWLGPSVLLGFTSPPTPIKGFLYFGAAFDVGWQIVADPGFTLNVGGGLMVIDASVAGTPTRVAPRALFGLGWTF